MAIGDTLRQRAGPLPVWGWAALGTAGVAGYLIYRRKQQAAAAATAIVYQYDSDGTNVRINNAGASPGNVTFYPVR